MRRTLNTMNNGLHAVKGSTSTWDWYTWIYIYIYICVCVYVCVCMWRGMYVCILYFFVSITYTKEWYRLIHVMWHTENRVGIDTPEVDGSTKSFKWNYDLVCINQGSTYAQHQLIQEFIQYIYIYIYIYIYFHPQTDCFVLSELFRVSRHVGHSKPGSKPIQLYVRLSLTLLGQQAYHVWLRDFLRYYIVTAAAVFLHFYTLSATRVLNSFEELCILRAAAENSFTRVLNPHGGASVYVCVWVPIKVYDSS